MTAGPAPHPGVEELWRRFLPLVRERVDLLTECAAAQESGRLSPRLRRDGAAAAHKLAGTLDSYGRAGGSAVAAEVEDLLGHDGGQGHRLAELVGRLRRVVEEES